MLFLRARTRSTVNDWKTEIEHSIVLPLPKKVYHKRDGYFPQTFKITLVTTFLKSPHTSQQFYR